IPLRIVFWRCYKPVLELVGALEDPPLVVSLLDTEGCFKEAESFLCPGLAHGFVPWETLSALEEVLGALKTIGVSIAQIDNLWSVKGGSLVGIEKKTVEFSRALAEYQNSARKEKILKALKVQHYSTSSVKKEECYRLKIHQIINFISLYDMPLLDAASEDRYPSASTPNSSSSKNKGLIVETYEWDDEEVSYDENEVTEVKALMALTDEERVSVSKESARNDNSDMSITSSNIPKSSKIENSTLPNQDIDEVPSNESQRNTIDPLVVVFDSLATDYDSPDESSICSTPLFSLKKLNSAEPVFAPKTIKSILKSKSTFKAKTLKEPSSAPARGKSSSASKTNSAPTGKLKNVKMEDDPPLTIHHTGHGESFSRSKPLRPSVSFPSCIYYGYNEHHYNDYAYYPTYDTNGHNMIISLRSGINPRNPQHITKNYEHVVVMFIPHQITMTLSGLGKEKLFKHTPRDKEEPKQDAFQVEVLMEYIREERHFQVLHGDGPLMELPGVTWETKMTCRKTRQDQSPWKNSGEASMSKDRPGLESSAPSWRSSIRRQSSGLEEPTLEAPPKPDNHNLISGFDYYLSFKVMRESKASRTTLV
nr:hypothetical protein [Tanacetum cinerariifolium]